MDDRQRRERVVAFVRPLLQDLDGHSRLPDVERVRTIALLLLPENDPDRDLLLYLHLLGGWLKKPGNRSRAALALTGIASESDLLRIESSIRRLESPVTPLERAVAAAILIDRAGIRGLVQQIAYSRREGLTIDEAIASSSELDAPPEWMPAAALEWFMRRLMARKQLVESFRIESELRDSDTSRD